MLKCGYFNRSRAVRLPWGCKIQAGPVKSRYNFREITRLEIYHASFEHSCL